MIEGIDVSLDVFQVLKNMSRTGPKYERLKVSVEVCGKCVRVHLQRDTHNIYRDFWIYDLENAQIDVLGYKLEGMVWSLEKLARDNH